MLYLFIGGSGAGKNFIVSKLGLPELPSCTTRRRRIGETEDSMNFFQSREEFLNNEMIEWAEYAGNLYGTLLSDFNNCKGAVAKIIEPLGAKQIVNKVDCKVIYVDVPVDVARARLVKRDGEVKESRFSKDIIDLFEEAKACADLVVYGDESAVQQIKDFIDRCEGEVNRCLS